MNAHSIGLDFTPVRVGRISFMNVAPLYDGFRPMSASAALEWISAPPSRLNAMLAGDGLDISPVSTYAYATHQDRWMALPGLAVACRDRVMSVLLVSRRPWAELDGRRLRLTRDSAAAAGLLKLLFARDGLQPRFEVDTVKRPEDLPAGIDAGLVIGDAALRHDWRQSFPFVWDLGGLWRDATGLPFVFAVWAVRRDFARRRPEDVRRVHQGFVNAKAALNETLPGICRRASASLNLSETHCRRYYHCLDYDLGPRHLQGLQTYFDGLRAAGLTQRTGRIRFFDPNCQPSCASMAA